MNERDPITQCSDENALEPNTMASLTELEAVLKSDHRFDVYDLLESVRMIKAAPGCTLHANNGMAICMTCRKKILCMTCDSIPCQCGFVFVDEDM